LYAIAPNISQSFPEKRRSSARRRYQENLTNYLNGILKMSKATNIKCEYCGGCGYHKMSCPTQKATVFLSDVKVEGVTAESDGVSGKHEGATKSGVSEIPTYQAGGIPTLEGDEAEELIRKADENVRLMRQRRCKNHVWRKDYLNGVKKCQVCGKPQEEVERSKDVEE